MFLERAHSTHGHHHSDTRVLSMLAAFLCVATWHVGFASPVAGARPAQVSVSLGLGPPIGHVLPRDAADIGASPWSVGAETQDRNYSYFPAWQKYLAPLGAKRARIEGGWARCEVSGVHGWLFDFMYPEVHP